MSKEDAQAEQYILTNAITIKALIRLLIQKHLITDHELTRMIEDVRQEAVEQAGAE